MSVERGDKKRISRKSSYISFPSSIFKDRSVSVLEALSEHLRDSKNMSYHEVAVLLNRDDRTIWTCYKRAKDKRKFVEQPNLSKISNKKLE